MCSIERRTKLWSQQCIQSTLMFHTVFLSTGQWPNITYIKENLPLLWYLGNQFRRNQQSNQLSVLWNFFTHTLRLVSPWGRPGNPAYPTAQRGYPMAREHTLLPNTLHTAWRGYPTAQGLQETTIQPGEATLQPRDFRGPPYAQETAPTVFPAYPASTTQTTRLQDCKYCQPTESITPRRGKIGQPAKGQPANQRNSPEEANTKKSLAEAA